MDRYITLADLTQHFKDYHTALVGAKIGDIPSLTEFFKADDGTTPLTIADGLKKVYDLSRKAFTMTDACDHDYWVANYKDEAPEAGDDFKTKLYYITDSWTETDGTVYQKGSLIIGYKSKSNADSTLSYEWIVVPSEGNVIGDTTTLDAKLRIADTADDGKVNMVKATNLAYTRSIVTVDDTITNTTTTEAEYKFTQDGTTICTVKVPKDVYVSKGEVIISDGSQVIGVNPADNSDLYATVNTRYLHLTYENSTKEDYVDLTDLEYAAEPISADLITGKYPHDIQVYVDRYTHRITADIIDHTVSHDELNDYTDKELDFIGYDHSNDYPAITGGAPVVQLDTTAQTLREGVNELKGNIGDTATLTTADKTSLVGAINEHDKEIGDIIALDTDEKNNLVEALNEVNTNADLNTQNIGDVTTLTTDAKTSAVVAINEVDAHADTNATNIGSLPTLVTTDKSDLVNAINEVDGIAIKALHLIAKTDNADFIATYQPATTVNDYDAVIITDAFTADGVDYKAGTWAYKFGGTWCYMNNGGGGDAIYLESTSTTPPTITTEAQISAIKEDKLYIFTDGDGNKSSYIYVKNSDTDATQNYWLQISSSTRGIEWIGTYNYVATTTITDPDTGAKTENVVPWEATAAQLAGISTWCYSTYGHEPYDSNLITLTVDSAYYGQYLFKNSTWQEYSSLTKATKAQYGVTLFSTMADYEKGSVEVATDGTITGTTDLVTNKAIDPWLLRQILSHVATDDNIYTKAQMDTLLALKADDVDLTNYYDKSQTDSKLKALQKAYVVTTDPSTMASDDLEAYWGSLLYYVDGSGSTHTYICDSTGTLQDLGASGVSLTGYVETTDSKYQTLSDIKLVDASGDPLTVQQQIDEKQDKITSGATTTVLTKDLTASRVLVSNSSGKIANSLITSAELAMLDDIDTSGDTIETRLQNLEAGGGGTGTGNSSVIFVTNLPTSDIDVKAIYRRTSDNTYWIYDNSEWHRLDNDANAHVINGNAVADDSTSESLDIVKSLTSAQYNALTSAEKNNGTIYCITDDATAVTSLVINGSTTGVSSVNGYSGAVLVRSLNVGGVTYPLVGDNTTITIPTTSSTGTSGVDSVNGYTGAVTLKKIQLDSGTAQALTGSGTISLTSAVTSVGGSTGAVSLKSISVDGGTAQSLVGSGTINVSSSPSATNVSYTAPSGAASTGATVQDVIDQLQARIAALEAAMPTFTLSGTTLTITQP